MSKDFMNWVRVFIVALIGGVMWVVSEFTQGVFLGASLISALIRVEDLLRQTNE